MNYLKNLKYKKEYYVHEDVESSGHLSALGIDTSAIKSLTLKVELDQESGVRRYYADGILVREEWL